MKLIIFLLIISSSLLTNAQSAIFIEKHGNLSGSTINVPVDFNRIKTNIVVPESGTYMILLSAQGSGAGNATCHHSEATVSVWSKTRNIELLKTPFDYIFADNSGTNAGLKHQSFPYYSIAIQSLSKNEILGLKAMVMKYCP